jgi:hypothetical protein
VRQSDEIKDLAAAMAKAQAEIRPALKDATNPHLKSKYADLASVWSAARDILGKHGLCVIQAPGKLEGTTLELTTRLLHQSGQWLESTISLPVVKLDAQTCGGAITYARRYSLSAMLGIVADDDDDGHSGTHGSQQRQQGGYQRREEPSRPLGAPGNGARPAGAAATAGAAGAQHGNTSFPSSSPVSERVTGALENQPAFAPESGGDRNATQGREPILSCSWQGCGEILTKGQHDVSLRAFGQPLCPKHQKATKDAVDTNTTPGYAR